MNDKISLREAFGMALVELGKARQDFVVFDADVAGGTCANYFRQAFPQRFFQCGVAEQNMMSMAAGFSTSGIIPVVTCYAVFASMRGIEQARNSIAYPNFNVKIVASHPGIDAGPDGPSHQCYEDFGMYTTLPNFKVISPCDDLEVFQALGAILDEPGPVYMRTGRSPLPRIHGPDYKFKIGRGEILRAGKDITIVATGIMAHRALEAARELELKNISAEVINISTLKPIDKEIILNSARKTNLIITAEDHSILNGLGSCVANVISENYPVLVKRLGVKDCFAESGPAGELARKYGLDKYAIVKQAAASFKEKNG